MRSLTAALPLVGLGLVSCASLVHPARLHNPSDAAWKEDSALVMGIRLEGPKEALNQGHCRLQVREIDEDRYYETTFPSVDSTLFLDLPPGRYVGHEIQCAYYSKWLIADSFPGGMRVLPEKISYGGTFLFRFAQDGKGLSVVKATRKVTQQHITATLGSTHAAHRGRWVAAYSGRPIHLSMINESSTGELRIQATWLHGEKHPIEPLTEALGACASQEDFEQDAVRIGQIRFVAQYKPGAEPTIESDLKNSALPVSYEECLLKALKEYRSPGTLKLEVKM